MPKNVRISPRATGHFARSRYLRPNSEKTYGNPVRRTACRKTYGFPAFADASLIGRLMAVPKNV
jgi:hypothetical protein